MDDDKLDKVISDLEQQIRWIEEIECHKFPGWLNCTNAMRDALELLKEQQEKIEKLQVNVEHWGKKYMEIRDTQPKIVMCKDCYYSERLDSYSVLDKQLFNCCHVSQIGQDKPKMHTGDWFCAYGQLKE